MTKKTGIIILAAGSSARLGKPKQLLSFEGKSLLKRVVDEASTDPENHLFVVLGALTDVLIPELAESNAEFTINPDWQDGMASSINSGLKAMLKTNPDMERCIITVCDQPYINSTIFHQLKTLAEETGKGIIATGFAQTRGVPVLFTKAYFESLLTLTGKEGAKKVIEKHTDDLAVFPFEPAQVDIDTLEDYYQLNHQMVSVSEAKEIIDFHLPKSENKSRVPIQDALGYTLASPIIADLAIPNFEQSSMDGYAIRHHERNKELLVVDEIAAGARVQKQLYEGQAMRIFTGAPLPLGADTIVMQEKVQVTERGTILIKDPEIKERENVRAKGSEVDEGALAMQEGTYLSPAAIGFLAGIGCTQVDIFTLPRIAIILTGNELKPLGMTLAFGEVYESNSYQLQSALKQLGIKNTGKYHALDDMQQIKTIMEEALQHYDVLLLVGGVSVGDYDYVTQVAKECGVEQRFHRIRQKPGKPLFFGTKQEKLIFGLPGNPSSALTCFYLYVAPALKKMMRLPMRKEIKTIVACDYYKKPGLTHFLKAHYNGTSVTPLFAQESYRLQSFAQANCLLILDEQSTGCKTNDEVIIHPLELS
jgi:molybdopterin molybdotransferase